MFIKSKVAWVEQIMTTFWNEERKSYNIFEKDKYTMDPEESNLSHQKAKKILVENDFWTKKDKKCINNA